MENWLESSSPSIRFPPSLSTIVSFSCLLKSSCSGPGGSKLDWTLWLGVLLEVSKLVSSVKSSFLWYEEKLKCEKLYAEVFRLQDTKINRRTVHVHRIRWLLWISVNQPYLASWTLSPQYSWLTEYIRTIPTCFKCSFCLVLNGKGMSHKAVTVSSRHPLLMCRRINFVSRTSDSLLVTILMSQSLDFL